MDIEERAREMGWTSQEEFKGAAERWVDADTWVERGENMLPLLRKDNESLRVEVRKLTELFKASQEAIEGLKEAHNENTQRAVEQAKHGVVAAIKTAREEGDVDLELKLTDELAELRTASKPQSMPQAAPPEPALDPEFKKWQASNPWFGADERKTMRAMGIAQELRSDPANDELVGIPFYQLMMEVMEERTGVSRTSKVGSSRPTGSSGGRGKSFGDLPPDAKNACMRQGKKLVGEGRAFKTGADWQAHYAKIYFQGEES